MSDGITKDELNESLDRFFKKLSELSSTVGRGGPTGNKAGSTGGTKAKTPDTPEERAYAERIKRLNKLHEAGIKLSSEDAEALKEHTKQTEDLTDATKDLESSMKYTKKQLVGLGKDMLTGNGSLGEASGRLASIFEDSSSRAGRAIYGFAAGASFALGAMENFAKSAADMGAFADLGAFSVGSLRQAKLLSGLGDSFIKVIENSQGGFKAFGSNSQAATENLSNLARGLRLGSYALNSTLRKNLGTELVGTMNKAAKSTAAMGLSQEDQANLMGTISSNVQLNAENEQDAQRKLVKQYAETVDSARTLSNTFGTSAKEILKSIENFNKSTAGKAAALQGVSGAQEIKQALAAAGVQGSEEDMNRMALALAKGQGMGVAGTYTTPESMANLQAVSNAVDQAKQAGGGKVTAEGLSQGMQSQRGTFEAIGRQRQDLGAKGQEGLFDTGVAAAELAKKLDLQAKAAAGDQKARDELAKQGTTTEADNIQTMDRLTGALDSLRGFIIGLTASVIGLTGMLAPLVLGGAGALIGGLTGKGGGLLGGLLGKGTGAAGAGAAGAAGAGAAAGGDAGSAIGNTLGGLGTGLGTLLEGLGKGIGKGASAILEGLATGLKFFADPMILLGAAILGGAITLIGAGIAGATWILGKALPTFAEGLASFDNINGDNLIKIGGGLAAMGAGAVVFAAGMAAATAGSILTGIMGLFGAKSPLEKVMEFVPYADAISALGQGMLNFGNGIIAMKTGLAGLAGVDISNLTTLLSDKGPLSKIKQFAENSNNISILGKGILDFGNGIIAMNTGLESLDVEKLANFKQNLTEISSLNLGNLSSIGSVIGSNQVSVDTSTVPTKFASDAINSNPNASNIAQSTVTPELIAQFTSYLSNIQNDLQAIRGNTKGSPSVAPVRLS